MKMEIWFVCVIVVCIILTTGMMDIGLEMIRMDEKKVREAIAYNLGLIKHLKEEAKI